VKILLTGVTGFIGSSIAEVLVDSGYEISAIIRESSDKDKIPQEVNVNVYSGTFCSMNSIFQNVQPDIVIHLASLFISEHKSEDVVNLIQSNVEFGTVLLEAMNKNNVKNIINTGSSWQHYNDEDYNPVNLYAATKQAFEAILRFYVEAKGFNAINLHLFDSFGVKDTRPKLLFLLRKIMYDGTELDMSSGEQEILLVNIKDLINGYLCAIDYLLKRRYKEFITFSICNLKDVLTIKDLVRTIEIITKNKLNVNFGRKEYREREVFKVWSKFRLLPNFNISTKLVDELKEYFNDDKSGI